ncbi:type I restriction endonuclease subunit R [Megalodesulfovibrio paquesii]
MHDISLGHTLEDYLTGEQVEATTYEDLRQALARLLVEERGWPKECLRPRQAIHFEIDGAPYVRLTDLIAFDAVGPAGAPLCLLDFCPGEVSTFVRETLAAARIHPQGPIPLAVVTDSKDAVLLAVATGETLAEGLHALPRWDTLTALAGAHPAPPLTAERLLREQRICYAYSESRHSCCSHAAACQLARGAGRLQQKTD